MGLNKSSLVFVLSLISGLIFNQAFFNLNFAGLLSIYTWIGSLFIGSFFTTYLFSKTKFKELSSFSIPLALLFCAWLSWMILHLAPINLTLPLLWILGAFGFYKLDKDIKLAQIKYFNIFLLIFWLILICLSFHPEIYWGEKPMDFNLFNFFGRNTNFPPEDPWFSGHKMKYYYFGYFMLGGLSSSLKIDPAISYHFSLATVAACFFLSGISLMQSLGHKFYKSILGSSLIFFGSSLGAYSAYLFDGKRGYLAFWGGTRVFKNQGFSEFPHWSFLFADLHPHVMSYPFTLFAFTLLYKIISNEKRNFSLLECSIVGFSTISLMALNSWDLVFLGLTFLPLFIYHYRKTFLNPSFYYSILIGLSAWSLSLLSLLGRGNGKMLRLYQGESNGILNYFLHQGGWWIIALLLLTRRIKEVNKQVFILGATFIALILFTENIIFLDRMNTIFKFGNQLFILGACLCLILYKESKYSNTVLSVSLCFFIFSFIFNQSNISKYDPFGSDRPTLDGGFYLRKTSPEDRLFITHINENIKGTPVLLETYGKSFENNRARISMHTGIPTYLGWEGHVIIRGAEPRLTLRRKKEIDSVYNSVDPLKTYEWLVKTGIDYLVVGGAEHVKYEAKGLAKFDQYIDLFTPLIQTRRGNKVFGLYKIGK